MRRSSEEKHLTAKVAKKGRKGKQNGWDSRVIAELSAFVGYECPNQAGNGVFTGLDVDAEI